MLYLFSMYKLFIFMEYLRKKINKDWLIDVGK